MSMVSEESTTRICVHCDRAIPLTNIDLHDAHCSRSHEKCKVCGDMVPRKHADEHYRSTHAPGSAEREARPPWRGDPPEFPRRHLFVTIAITGIALLLGSFFFQKKAESSTVPKWVELKRLIMK